MDTFLEILKYTLPALIVLISNAIIINRFLVTRIKKKQLALFREGMETTLPLKMQAYERLTVFLERIHPREIIPRVYVKGMSAKELRIALVANIKAEFEHNISQQVYVSPQVWRTLVMVKEQEMVMINSLADQMPEGATANDLHKRILDFLVTDSSEETPRDIALELINNEAKMVLSMNY